MLYKWREVELAGSANTAAVRLERGTDEDVEFPAPGAGAQGQGACARRQAGDTVVEGLGGRDACREAGLSAGLSAANRSRRWKPGTTTLTRTVVVEEATLLRQTRAAHQSRSQVGPSTF